MLFPAVLCGVTVIPHKMPRKKGLIGWVPASGIIIDFFLYNFIHSQNYLQEDTFLKKPRKPQGTLPNPEQHMSGPQVGGVGAAQAVLLGPDARYRTSAVTRPPRLHGSPGPSHPRCRQMAKASPAPPHSGPLATSPGLWAQVPSLPQPVSGGGEGPVHSDPEKPKPDVS